MTVQNVVLKCPSHYINMYDLHYSCLNNFLDHTSSESKIHSQNMEHISTTSCGVTYLITECLELFTKDLVGGAV